MKNLEKKSNRKKNSGFTPTPTLEGNKSKLVSGFTLIELLTAIAIIGILSAVVMVSLNSARMKSKDKAVMTELSSIKVQAEIYYDLNGSSYSGLCNKAITERGLGGVDGPGLLSDVKKNTAIPSNISITSSQAGRFDYVTCHDSASAWAVEAPTSKSTQSMVSMYCVDNKNMVTEKTTRLAEGDTGC